MHLSLVVDGTNRKHIAWTGIHLLNFRTRHVSPSQICTIYTDEETLAFSKKFGLVKSSEGKK